MEAHRVASSVQGVWRFSFALPHFLQVGRHPCNFNQTNPHCKTISALDIYMYMSPSQSWHTPSTPSFCHADIPLPPNACPRVRQHHLLPPDLPAATMWCAPQQRWCACCHAAHSRNSRPTRNQSLRWGSGCGRAR
jgi:hypothetical protein